MTSKKDDGSFDSAMVSAQKLIGGARKTATNPHFKSKYADLKECFNACSDILNDHGIHITQPVCGDKVVTILTHISGAVREDGGVPLLGYQNAKNPMQALGSAITYARRYGLCSMVGIAPEDDDGNSLVQETAGPISAKQVEVLEGVGEMVGADMVAFCKYLKVDSLKELPENKYNAAMAALEKKRNK
tara:strand:+ start:2482 stop:3045 length:564 start_codon:yes stop_codon:yes gene_type:complete